MRITANLPSRDFSKTAAFYERLGFVTAYRDDGWMILTLGDERIEFFPHPDLDKTSSWFSACLRLPDAAALTALHAQFARAGLPGDSTSIPRLTAIFRPGAQAPRMFALVDADGSLWRCMDDSSVG